VSSHALAEWRGPATKALNEVVNAHRAVGGHRPGRRHLTQQINYAYVALLAAQFQGYCRSLHSEAATAIAALMGGRPLVVLVSGLLTEGRKLDAGNATPSALGSDFGRRASLRCRRPH
jgi:hypothetical protein